MYLKNIIGITALCKNWQVVLLNKLCSKYRINIIPLRQIKLRTGAVFRVSENQIGSDLLILNEIWKEQYYTPPFFQIKERDTVFDIGANKGYFTVFAAQQARQGRVYCFEPVPSLNKNIHQNIELNGLKNVFVNQLAITNKEGMIDFYLSASNSGGHSAFVGNGVTQKVKVLAQTLQHFCFENAIERINFLKMDCEGSEYDILLNMEPSIFNIIEKIAMEYHEGLGGHNHMEIVEYLSKSNFVVAKNHGYLYAINKSRLNPITANMAI